MAGAKSKLTKELIAQAVKYKKRGTPNKDICAALGITETSFYRWIENGGETELERELCESLKNAEADYKTALRVEIEKQGREKDWKALAWLLERQYPSEYGRVDRLQAEVKAETDAKIQVTHFFDYGSGAEEGLDD